MMQSKISCPFKAIKEIGNGCKMVSTKSLPVQTMFAIHHIVQTSVGVY